MNQIPERGQTPNRGMLAVRTFKALAIAKGDPASAVAYAKSQNWLDTDLMEQSIQMAAVTATGTDNVGRPSPAAFDFSEFIRPFTILGKLTGLRRVPSRTRLISATSGSTAYWSGERAVRPISRSTLEGSTLEPLSLIAMLVVTNELLQSSAPTAESVLSRDLAAAVVSALDLAFIDHTNAGVAGAKPAGIAYGTTPIVSAGATLANIDSDLGLMVTALSNAGSDLQFATWIMAPRTALYLARLRGTGGDRAYPGISVKGGELLGLPVVISANVVQEGGSPGFGDLSITLLDSSQVLYADDGATAVEVSRVTSVQQESAPTQGAAAMVSMFQTDSAVLRITRWANWLRCRAGMAQILSGVVY